MTMTHSSSVSLSNALAAALARHAGRSFGLMGNGNAHLIQGLVDLGVPYTAVRHEAGAVAAADAFTRISGRLAIATTAYGPSFTNALTPLAEAAHARTPLLMVVGDAPTDGRRPWDVDQEMLAAALGVRTYEVTVRGIDEVVDRAVSYALRARRPVVLAVPCDLVTAPTRSATGPVDIQRTPSEAIDANDPAVLATLLASVAAAPTKPSVSTAPTKIAPTKLQIDNAVAVLLSAERPLVLAGHGAVLACAQQELGVIADRLGALTATTALARNVFPRPEFDLGVSGGFAQPAAGEYIAAADVVLIVGASFERVSARFRSIFGADTKIIRIDEQQLEAPPGVHEQRHIMLQGDAKATLQTLTGAYATAGGRSTSWREQVEGLEPGGALRVRENGLEEHPDGICADGKLDPRTVAARIGEILPEDIHITVDGNRSSTWPNMYWPVRAPERLTMVGSSFHTIGLGISTIAGVAAAAPGTTTVLSTGDGGGLMALADLETAVRNSQSSIIVVWNDGAYGAEVAHYGALGLDEAPMLIPDVDFASIATAFGARGVTVRTMLDLTALEHWIAAGAAGTILLDCRISRGIVPQSRFTAL